eukprot:Rmarinus@m.21269
MKIYAVCKIVQKNLEDSGGLGEKGTTRVTSSLSSALLSILVITRQKLQQTNFTMPGRRLLTEGVTPHNRHRPNDPPCPAAGCRRVGRLWKEKHADSSADVPMKRIKKSRSRLPFRKPTGESLYSFMGKPGEMLIVNTHDLSKDPMNRDRPIIKEELAEIPSSPVSDVEESFGYEKVISSTATPDFDLTGSVSAAESSSAWSGVGRVDKPASTPVNSPLVSSSRDVSPLDLKKPPNKFISPISSGLLPPISGAKGDFTLPKAWAPTDAAQVSKRSLKPTTGGEKSERPDEKTFDRSLRPNEKPFDKPYESAPLFSPVMGTMQLDVEGEHDARSCCTLNLPSVFNQLRGSDWGNWIESME